MFLDEHPDSIDDGYFVNRDNAGSGGYYGMNAVIASEWLDLPASYHNRSAAFSFADGHAALHRWLKSSTLLPATPETYLPVQVPATPDGANADFEWVVGHMSVQN